MPAICVPSGIENGGYVDVIYPPWDRYMGDSIYPGKEYMVMLVYAIPCWHTADTLGNRYELTPLMIEMQCENSADWFQVSPAAYANEEEGARWWFGCRGTNSGGGRAYHWRRSSSGCARVSQRFEVGRRLERWYGNGK